MADLLRARFNPDTSSTAEALLGIRKPACMDVFQGPFVGGGTGGGLTKQLSMRAVVAMRWDCTRLVDGRGQLLGAAISCHVESMRRSKVPGYRLLVLLAVRGGYERSGNGGKIFNAVKAKAGSDAEGAQVLVLAAHSGKYTAFWQRKCLGLTQLVGADADLYNATFNPFPDPASSIRLLRSDGMRAAVDAAPAAAPRMQLPPAEEAGAEAGAAEAAEAARAAEAAVAPALPKGGGVLARPGGLSSSSVAAAFQLAAGAAAAAAQFSTPASRPPDAAPRKRPEKRPQPAPAPAPEPEPEP